MPDFKGSAEPTVGVETELQLIDPETFDLAPKSVPILNELHQAGHHRFKFELSQGMVEINSDVAANIKELREDLRAKIAILREVAAKHDVLLAAAGTHPFHNKHHKIYVPDERYARIVDSYQFVVKKLSIMGVHVHVSVKDGKRAILLTNKLIEYLPHILALSTSSPFWESEDTGMASARTPIFEALPTAGLPPMFENWDQFQHYFSVMQKRGAIDSIRDLYWDIRPHPNFGTLEFRMCDGISSFSDLLAIATLIRCLVIYLDEKCEKDPKFCAEGKSERFWLAPQNKWRAARYGLDAQVIKSNNQQISIRSDLKRMLKDLHKVAVEYNCVEELEGVKRILKNGTSAERQRAVYKKRGSFQKVVEHLVNEFAAE